MSSSRIHDSQAKLTWLFDLDDTLHDASRHIFPHIHRDMTRYVAENLQLDEAAANRLRIEYWQRYGATLNGMMRHHDTDPAHFLWHTHQFPDLASLLVFERQLRHMLRRLPGRKLLFTNAPAHYASAVLDAMQVSTLFAEIYSIEKLGFRPKPQIQGFLRLLRSEGLAPRHCVMVEDSAENLRTAKKLGMKTILIRRQGPACPGWVDLPLKSVLELPRHLGRLRKHPPIHPDK
ncbi:MAG: pyrimidine 5'-nucleotidase [Sterolibacterium sp.]|nr:pyrimidine 5'-nucleotidase [Sterolibacterium sp.]